MAQGFNVYFSSENDSREWFLENFRLGLMEVANDGKAEIPKRLPRPFLSRLMLLYPPPPMLSSSRSRHSIVVLNSYDDEPSILSNSSS